MKFLLMGYSDDEWRRLSPDTACERDDESGQESGRAEERDSDSATWRWCERDDTVTSDGEPNALDAAL